MAGSRATSALAGTRFGPIRWVGETASTNADALAAAREGAAEGLVVAADHQTSGRGRHDRTWLDQPSGSLLMSVLLRPPAPLVAFVPMAFGVALVEGVLDVTGVQLGLKWPNDLVVPRDHPLADRKLAGMLTEIDWPGDGEKGRPAMVIGVGINVNWAGHVPDAALTATAAALDEVAGHAVDREDALIALLKRFDVIYGQLTDGLTEPAAIVAAWRSALATIGRRVSVTVPREPAVDGVAVDVTPEGHLVIEVDEGSRLTLAAGDVVHLRHPT